VTPRLFWLSCALLGLSCGYLAGVTLALVLLSSRVPAPGLPARAATDFAGDVENWLRREGY
jgi:hypothetical protein